MQGQGSTAAQLLVDTALQNSITNYLTGLTVAAGKPQAGVYWLALDQQLHYVSTSSGFSQVGSGGCGNINPVIPKATSNGYLFIFVANQTPQLFVYYDNLQLEHIHSPVLEETSYYPFGLTMAGISYKAASSLENRFKYNGIELQHGEFSDGSGLDIYAARFRNLDPQLGRFWQQDPAAESFESTSLYASMGNNPICNEDPLGDFETKFGAWWHKLWHGGGTIGQNKQGEYYVSKSTVTTAENGDAKITTTLNYGNGRDANSSLREKAVDMVDQQQREQQWTKDGLWDPTMTAHEAGMSALGTGTGLVLPTTFIRPITVAGFMGRAARWANTIKNITTHLEQFGAKAENTVMLGRLKEIANGTLEATEIDLNFMKHELREAELMKEGMVYRDAHDAVLKEQGMYHRGYDEKLYTKEALEAGNEQMRMESEGKQ